MVGAVQAVSDCKSSLMQDALRRLLACDELASPLAFA